VDIKGWAYGDFGKKGEDTFDGVERLLFQVPEMM